MKRAIVTFFSGAVLLLAACDYTPHDFPEDIARSHDGVMDSLSSDIDYTGPTPVYATSHRAADFLSTPVRALDDMTCGEFQAEIGPFARAAARQRELGWAAGEDEFSVSFKSCEF